MRKGTVAYGRKLAAFDIEYHRCQSVAVIESIVAYGFYAVGKIEVNQTVAAVECTVAYGFKRGSRAVCKADLFKIADVLVTSR